MVKILFKSVVDLEYYYYGRELRLWDNDKDIIIYNEKTARKALKKNLLKSYTVVEHERDFKHPHGDRQNGRLTLLFVEINDDDALIVGNGARHVIYEP